MPPLLAAARPLEWNKAFEALHLALVGVVDLESSWAERAAGRREAHSLTDDDIMVE